MGGPAPGDGGLRGRHPGGRVLVRSAGVLSWRDLMKRGIILGVLVVAGGLSLAAAGVQAPGGRGAQGPNVAEIEKVNDRLYMITGGGGNTAAFITDNGVVLVDTK